MSKFFLKIFVILLINFSTALAQDSSSPQANDSPSTVVNKNDFEERKNKRRTELKEKIEARNREIKERNAQRIKEREERKQERRGGDVNSESNTNPAMERRQQRREDRREERREDRREERREERREDRREERRGNSSQIMPPNNAQENTAPAASPAAVRAPRR